jgi:hypothetical protein
MAHCVLEDAHLGGARGAVTRQEALGNSVVPFVRELDSGAAKDAFVVGVGQLQENARSVARARVAPCRASVREASKDFDSLCDHVV